jgi:hypothetical protein
VATTEDLPVYKTRNLISNFTWSEDALRDWNDIWTALWRLGFKWQWKNGDRYARVCGDSFKCYTVWNDANRLDGAFPIPQIHVLGEIKELLLDDPSDDSTIPYTVKAINDWFNLHYTFKVTLDLHGED